MIPLRKQFLKGMMISSSSVAIWVKGPARRVVAGVEPSYEPGVGPLLDAGVARVVPVRIVFGRQIKVLGGGVLALSLPVVRAVVGGRETDEVSTLLLPPRYLIQ
jgi:hypothetical protein